MRKLLFVALAMLLLCATAYAQPPNLPAESRVGVGGIMIQGAGGEVGAGVHYPVLYAYSEGIGGSASLQTPIMDLLEQHGIGEDWKWDGVIDTEYAQMAILAGGTDTDGGPDAGNQVDVHAWYYGAQKQYQINQATIGTGTVGAVTYMWQFQEVGGASSENGYAWSFAYGFNDPQENVFAGGATLSIGDPTNVGIVAAEFGIEGGMAVGAGAEAEDPGEPPDYAWGYSETGVGAKAWYTNAVNNDTFQSYNEGYTSSQFTMWAEANATGVGEIGEGGETMYATIFDPGAEAFSAGGIAIQSDSDALGMAGGTVMSATIYGAYYSTEGEFEEGVGSEVGMRIDQSSYFQASATQATSTGELSSWQLFEAGQTVEFRAKDGDRWLPF